MKVRIRRDLIPDICTTVSGLKVSPCKVHFKTMHLVTGLQPCKYISLNFTALLRPFLQNRLTHNHKQGEGVVRNAIYLHLRLKSLYFLDCFKRFAFFSSRITQELNSKLPVFCVYILFFFLILLEVLRNQ
jgi:hypothetical protein